MSSWSAKVEASVGELSLQVEFEAGPGPLVLIGPNASGKSSLLRIIAGLQPAHLARLVVGDTILEDTQAGVRLPVEARGIGYVPQGYGL